MNTLPTGSFGQGFWHKATKMGDPSRLTMVTWPFTATLEGLLEGLYLVSTVA
jgi:hypothetical protein